MCSVWAVRKAGLLRLDVLFLWLCEVVMAPRWLQTITRLCAHADEFPPLAALLLLLSIDANRFSLQGAKPVAKAGCLAH